MLLFRILSLLVTGSLLACGGSSSPAQSPPPEQTLELIAFYPLAVSDPSGLALDRDGIHLWTVSNDPGQGMYQLTRQGAVVRHSPFNSDDLEGIAVDPDNRLVYAVSDADSRLYVYSY